MPATPNDYPTSYAEAAQMLAGKNGKTLAGTATRLERVSGLDGDSYAVKYHSTDIVMFHADGMVSLNTDGYDTPTTARKMRACLTKQPYSVHLVKGHLHITYGAGVMRLFNRPVTVNAEKDRITIYLYNGNEVTLR